MDHKQSVGYRSGMDILNRLNSKKRAKKEKNLMLALNIHFGLLENTLCHIQWSEVKRKISNTTILPHNDPSYGDQNFVPAAQD